MKVLQKKLEEFSTISSMAVSENSTTMPLIFTTDEMTTAVIQLTCVDNPCRNGATCVDVTSTNDTRSYQCICGFQYTGTQCQHGKLYIFDQKLLFG